MPKQYSVLVGAAQRKTLRKIGSFTPFPSESSHLVHSTAKQVHFQPVRKAQRVHRPVVTVGVSPFCSQDFFLFCFFGNTVATGNFVSSLPFSALLAFPSVDWNVREKQDLKEKSGSLGTRRHEIFKCLIFLRHSLFFSCIKHPSKHDDSLFSAVSRPG